MGSNLFNVAAALIQTEGVMAKAKGGTSAKGKTGLGFGKIFLVAANSVESELKSAKQEVSLEPNNLFSAMFASGMPVQISTQTVMPVSPGNVPAEASGEGAELINSVCVQETLANGTGSSAVGVNLQTAGHEQQPLSDIGKAVTAGTTEASVANSGKSDVQQIMQPSVVTQQAIPAINLNEAKTAFVIPSQLTDVKVDSENALSAMNPAMVAEAEQPILTVSETKSVIQQMPKDYQLKSSETTVMFNATTSLRSAQQDTQPTETTNQTVVSSTNADNKISMMQQMSNAFSGEQNGENPAALPKNQEMMPPVSQKETEITGSFYNLFAHRTDPSSSQPAAGIVSSQSPPSLPQDPYHIAGQIVDQAKLIKGTENSEMVIKLKPEHLGELTLKISVEAGMVSASFHANNAEVRGVIEASLQQLRQDMTNQGLKVDYVGVYAGLGQSLPDGQKEGYRQQVFKSTGKKDDSADFSPILESVDEPSAVQGTTGVDYRI